MADVAREAGVSVSTVSHVVNQTRYIHPHTEKRVQSAILRTGFVTNPLARALAGRPTASIGASLSSDATLYFPAMVKALSVTAHSLGNSLFVMDSLGDRDRELSNITALHQRGVDGVLIAPATGSTAEGPALQYLRSRNIPAVVLDSCVGAGFDQVANKNWSWQLKSPAI